MSGKPLYEWDAVRRTSDWKLEGNGEVLIAGDGDLHLRTFHCGPGRRATTVWLKDLDLPDNFRIEWTFRSEAADGNTMLIFNARPLGLSDLFEDARPDARYCDLASYGKIVCHTVGFHRAVYGRPSVLRKIGGRVPQEWGQMTWGGPYTESIEKETTLSSQKELLVPTDKGTPHPYMLERENDRLRFWLNGALVHDVRDEGQYKYYPEPLRGGRMAFRNFGGYADDFYTSLRVTAL
ncbi:MAG: DUF1961 family protein [Planctomycetes bacterium]|nr:DUF1961 family protein [Planctomycetota bacterium]